MIGKRLGWTLVVTGAALVALAVFADALGVGAGDYVFGWEQKAAVAIGCTVTTFTCLSMCGWRLPIERRGGSVETMRSTAASS
jgi:hypothetical protein